MALRDLGFALGDLGHYNEALEPLAQAEGLLALASLDELPPEIRVRRVTTSLLAGRYDDVLALSEELLAPESVYERLGPLARAAVSSARIDALKRLGRWKDIAEEAQTLLSGVEPESSPLLYAEIVNAHSALARAARELGSPEAALVAGDAAVAAARSAPLDARDSGLRVALIAAMCERADAFEALEEIDQARAAYGDLIAEFRWTADVRFQRMVLFARRRKLGLRLQRHLNRSARVDVQN